MCHSNRLFSVFVLPDTPTTMCFLIGVNCSFTRNNDGPSMWPTFKICREMGACVLQVSARGINKNKGPVPSEPSLSLQISLCFHGSSATYCCTCNTPTRSNSLEVHFATKPQEFIVIGPMIRRSMTGFSPAFVCGITWPMFSLGLSCT